MALLPYQAPLKGELSQLAVTEGLQIKSEVKPFRLPPKAEATSPDRGGLCGYYTRFCFLSQLLFDKGLYFYYYIICKSSPMKEEPKIHESCKVS